MNTVKLGQAINAKRKKLGISQEKVAFLSGISTRHVNLIENGKTNPTFTTLIGIAKALKVSLKELV